MRTTHKAAARKNRRAARARRAIGVARTGGPESLLLTRVMRLISAGEPAGASPQQQPARTDGAAGNQAQQEDQK